MLGGAVGSTYGIFNVIHDKNEKIVSAVTKKEMNEMFKGLRDTTQMVYKNQVDLSTTVNGVIGGFGIMEQNIITHIRNDKDIPTEQKFDIILKLMKQIDSTMLKANMIKPNVSIKTERLWPTENR